MHVVLWQLSRLSNSLKGDQFGKKIFLAPPAGSNYTSELTHIMVEQRCLVATFVFPPSFLRSESGNGKLKES